MENFLFVICICGHLSSSVQLEQNEPIRMVRIRREEHPNLLATAKCKGCCNSVPRPRAYCIVIVSFRFSLRTAVCRSIQQGPDEHLPQFRGKPLSPALLFIPLVCQRFSRFPLPCVFFLPSFLSSLPLNGRLFPARSRSRFLRCTCVVRTRDYTGGCVGVRSSCKGKKLACTCIGVPS